MKSDAFARARDALEASEIYPMLSPEYRAAVQHALQELKRAAAEAGTTVDQTSFADYADRLVAFLGVEWDLIDIVEVRRGDGSTEIIDLRDGDEAIARLHGVKAFRVVAARDQDEEIL